MTTPTPTVDPEIAAARQLDALRASGLARFHTSSRYVVQLGSKWVGIVDPRQQTRSGSHEFRAVDILDEFNQLAREHSGALLLQSTDFGKQVDYPSKPPGEPLWVMIVDLPEGTTLQAAQNWCATAFPGLSGDDLLNVCMPRQALPPWR